MTMFSDKSYFLFVPFFASCQALKSKKEEKSSRKVRKSFRVLALETAKILQKSAKNREKKNSG